MYRKKITTQLCLFSVEIKELWRVVECAAKQRQSLTVDVSYSYAYAPCNIGVDTRTS